MSVARITVAIALLQRREPSGSDQLINEGSVAIKEPSAVAPDPGVNFSNDYDSRGFIRVFEVDSGIRSYRARCCNGERLIS
jgi:hypothetical protein